MENKKSHIDHKNFNFIKGLSAKTKNVQAAYNWMNFEFLPQTFGDRVLVKDDHVVSLGADPDYTFGDHYQMDNLAAVNESLAEERAQYDNPDLDATFQIGSLVGGDWDHPLAKAAMATYTEENGGHNFYEVWMSAPLHGKDGNADLQFTDKVKTAAEKYTITMAGENPQTMEQDLEDFAMAYDQSINAADSVYASDIDTKQYVKKILIPDDAKTPKIITPKQIVTLGDLNQSTKIMVLLARENQTNQTVGFLIGGTNGKYAYINDVGVIHKHRQNGVGSLLIKNFHTIAKAKYGAQEVWLDTEYQHPRNEKIYADIGYQRELVTLLAGPDAETETTAETEPTK